MPRYYSHEEAEELLWLFIKQYRSISQAAAALGIDPH